MTVIGLTGGIASGKSTAAQMLEGHGAVVVDADRLGHRVYDPGTPGFEAVVNEFGHDLVAEDGTIDRKVLGGKVFGRADQMERLTSIVWPEIKRIAIEEFAKIRRDEPDRVIVFEAAVLIEAEWQDIVDEVWVVSVKPALAIKRLGERNNFTEEQAQARLDSQLSNKEREAHADVKINNSDDVAKLEGRVKRAWNALAKRRAEAASK